MINFVYWFVCVCVCKVMGFLIVCGVYIFVRVILYCDLGVLLCVFFEKK